MMPPTAMDHFTSGNGSLTPMFWNEGKSSDFFHGIPERQRALNRLTRKQISVQKKAAQEISQSNIESAKIISNEIQLQTASLTQFIESSSDNIVIAVEHLETQVCAELSEIRWQLTQMSDSLNEIVYTLQRPRGTEAQELVRQGVLNYNNGKFVEAEERFLKALELDNTDYQVLYNLSFIELHKDNLDAALIYLKDAFRLPDNTSNSAKSDVLSTIARVYYIKKQYNDALSAALKAIELKSIPKRVYRAAIYAFFNNEIKKGEKLLAQSIEADYHLYAVAASDPDLEPYNDYALHILQQITSSHLNKHNKMIEKLKRNYVHMADCNDEASISYNRKLDTIYTDTINSQPVNFTEIINRNKQLNTLLKMIDSYNHLPQLVADRTLLTNKKIHLKVSIKGLKSTSKLSGIVIVLSFIAAVISYLYFGFSVAPSVAGGRGIGGPIGSLIWPATLFLTVFVDSLSSEIEFSVFTSTIMKFIFSIATIFLIAVATNLTSGFVERKAKSKTNTLSNIDLEIESKKNEINMVKKSLNQKLECF